MLRFYTSFRIQSAASILSTAASIGAFYAKTMLHFLEGMLHHVRNESLFTMEHCKKVMLHFNSFPNTLYTVIKECCVD